MSASSVEIERNEAAAVEPRGACSSLTVKPPPAVRREGAGALASAVPFGPVIRMTIDPNRRWIGPRIP
jgi:hypothetical protein